MTDEKLTFDKWLLALRTDYLDAGRTTEGEVVLYILDELDRRSNPAPVADLPLRDAIRLAIANDPETQRPFYITCPECKAGSSFLTCKTCKGDGHIERVETASEFTDKQLDRIADIVAAVCAAQAAPEVAGTVLDRVTAFGEWLKRLRADYSNAGRYREDDVALYILAEFRERFPGAITTADPSDDFKEGEK